MDDTPTELHYDLIPKCKVADEFILELKDAELHRTIEYKNTTSRTIPVSLGKKEFLYPYHCEDFSVTVNESPIDFKLFPKNYVQNLQIDTETIDLIPGAELRIKIVCRWRDFYNFISDLHYNFQYDEVATYKIVFRNYSLSNALHIVKINDKEAVKDDDYFIQHNTVIFKEVNISSNDELCLRLFSISTPVDLGILEASKENNKSLFSNLNVIVIQHLLSDAVHLVEAFHQGGATKDGIFIVGIPYSTKHPTVKYLRDRGYANIWTPTKYPFEEEVKQVIEKVISDSELNSKKILVVEDGGYVVPLLHKQFLDKAHLFVGAVEQTANGIWRDQDIEKGGTKIVIPVINVAESDIKKKLESPLIGRSVSKNIELIYNKSYRGIAGVEVGLIGYGSTGSQVGMTLKNMGAIVSVYDPDSTRRTDAAKEGLKVLSSIREVVKQSKIVVEATGKIWSEDENEMGNIIFDFQQGSYFVSASSKRLGINHDEFLKLIDKSKTVNIPGVGVQYKLRNHSGCELTLIADGYPVNFFLGESVPDRDIAFILAWLYKGAEILVKKFDELPKGIIDTNDKADKWGLLAAQNKIAELNEKKIS